MGFANFTQLFCFYLRKRQREEEIETQEKAKREREWQKNFEVSIQKGDLLIFFFLITLQLI